MQIAFTLYMIVLFPGGAPVVTNVGTWQKASDCGTAADGAFVRKNTQGEQVPSISFVCVPRSGFGIRGMPISLERTSGVWSHRSIGARDGDQVLMNETPPFRGISSATRFRMR